MSRVRATVLALGLALAGAVVAPTAPAYAAACSGTSGVTVVVSSPSGTSVRCAPGDPSSGLGALSAAGLSVTQVQTQPGFVCRINGYPSTDPCVRTPPRNAYWSYWHAKRGGSWSYSTSGAGTYNPAPGTVEGWSFGSGAAPATAPPAATTTPAPVPSSTPKPSPTPSPKPSVRTTPRTAAPRPSAPRAGSSASSSPSAPTTPKPKPSAAATTRQPSTSATSTGSTTAATATTTDQATALAAGPASSVTSGAGSPWPLLGGLALVLAVGGGAAYAARRSRAH